MDHLKIKYIRLEPRPGGHIAKCMQEASDIAKEMKCFVTFNHNGTEWQSDDEGHVSKVMVK